MCTDYRSEIILPYDAREIFVENIQRGMTFDELQPVKIPRCFECLGIVALLQLRDEFSDIFPCIVWGVHLPPIPHPHAKYVRKELFSVIELNQDTHRLVYVGYGGGNIHTGAGKRTYEYMMDTFITPLLLLAARDNAVVKGRQPAEGNRSTTIIIDPLKVFRSLPKPIQ